MTPPANAVKGCVLCEQPGGRVVFDGPAFRVIHAEEEGFPAFYRLVWSAHTVEFSDLTKSERAHCMEAVAIVEQSLRETLTPAKINIAALGNMTPHLHWHVIARFAWDSHFPSPFWAAPQRAVPAERVASVRALLPMAEAGMALRLARAY